MTGNGQRQSNERDRDAGDIHRPHELGGAAARWEHHGAKRRLERPNAAPLQGDAGRGDGGGGGPRGGTRPPLPGLVLASPRLQGPTTALCDGTRHATDEVATHLSDRSRDRLLSREGWRLVRLLDSEADSASLRPFAAESTLP